MVEMEDKDLLALYKEGKINYAFNLIVEKYKKNIYFYIRRLVIDHDDADDLLQITFIKAWKGLEKFREDSTLFTWLYRIATNESISFLNQKKRKFFIPLINIENDLKNKLQSDYYFNGDELQLKLQKAILTLPEKQRIVFNMKYYQDLKYEEISEILGTSIGALKASYHLAVKKIETYIQNH